MTSALFRELHWLRQPPQDFRSRCRQAGMTGPLLRNLADHALDINQLSQLAKLVDRARKEGAPMAPLVSFRLGIVSNATTALIAPALTGTALRYGLLLEIVETGYDQALQASVDPESTLHRARPDAVLIALDHRGLRLRASPGDGAAAGRSVDEAMDYLNAIRAGLETAGVALTIVQTIPPPPESLFGGLDRQIVGTPRAMVELLNRRLADELRGSGTLLLDVSALADTVGLACWHDPVHWTVAKLPFSQSLVPLYAEHVCRLIGAARGKSRRCLVLDLDNTLWGGVVGDEGLEGIRIGEGDGVGEAYLSLQRYVLELRDRGVVLAVVSKNDDHIARLPFRAHPEMVLKEEHIAVFQANWEDKASNIAAVAEALSLGLDSLVFLDDNPAERELVRQRLPQVAVPELPSDPALYARTLAAAGYFEAVAFSPEDRRRAADYQDNAQRLRLRVTAPSLDDYLRSLEMRMTVSPFDAVSRTRVTQLINKSNQFNLTTRRYTEAQVKVLETDRSAFTMQVRLADRFGDLGLISVVICRKHGRRWDIETWLMSCRVLKRRVEEAVLGEIIRAARHAGVTELHGFYRPTERNAMVAGHFEALGFALVASEPDGSTEWRLAVSKDLDHDVPIRVTHAYSGNSHVPLVTVSTLRETVAPA